VPVDPNQAADIPEVPNGTTLILTLDRDLQAATEQILDDSLTKYGAQGGTIVIMDPRNGEILAWLPPRAWTSINFGIIRASIITPVNIISRSVRLMNPALC